METQNQELKLLRGFERDSEWFHNNIDLLRKRGFTEKFVAVKEKDVISSEKDMDLLVESLERKGENPSYLFIEFVHPKGFTLLLWKWKEYL